MAELYTLRTPPDEYDAVWLADELRRIEASFTYMESEAIRITPTHVVPFRALEGEIRNADGTDWNPGAGGGLYQRLAGAWVKL